MLSAHTFGLILGMLQTGVPNIYWFCCVICLLEQNGVADYSSFWAIVNLQFLGGEQGV